MQKDLLQQLVEKPQRETAGADTASRFDYQKNWAFCEMLRRHMDGADYLVAFEFHDDVVFLDPNSTPNGAEFFQVKTSTSAKPRKLNDLVSREKRANSILGKMFLNFNGICSGHGIRVILVSNVAFEFADTNLCAGDLEPKYRERIVEKLKAEISTFSESHIDNLHFMITGVSINAIQSFLHGEAMALFKMRFGENHGFNVYSWVRLIQGEIARKNNHTSGEIACVSELIGKKCISKKEVEESLSVISAQRKSAPDIMLVNQELQAAGWMSQDLMRLGKRLPQVTADYTDSTNLEVSSIVISLEALFEKHQTSNPSLAKYIELAEADILPLLPTPYNDRSYLAALGLMVYYEKI